MKPFGLAVSAAIGMLCCAFPIRAQFATIINVPHDIAPSQIGSNTQLNLFDGGALTAYFHAGVSDVMSTNLELNVIGGVVGDHLFALPGSTINLNGGLVEYYFEAFRSTVNVDGGRITNYFKAADSTVNIQSGNVDSYFEIRDGTTLNITGGSVGSDFLARTGTTVSVSGGTLGSWGTEPGTTTNITGGFLGRAHLDGQVNIRGGAFGVNFTAAHTSQVEIFGGEFRVNGNLIDGLDSVGNSLPFNLAAGDTLSGTFADGTPFAFSSWNDDSFRARCAHTDRRRITTDWSIANRGVPRTGSTGNPPGPDFGGGSRNRRAQQLQRGTQQ